MPSVGTSYAEKKNKKFFAISAGKLYTSAQLNAALNASGYSATPTRLGQLSIASATIAGADLLGSTVTFATDADLGKLFTATTYGLNSVTPLSLTVGESVLSLGRKLRMGTVAFSDLLTFTQVKRTAQGLTTVNGDGGVSATDDSQFGVYWIITEVTAELNAASILKTAPTSAAFGAVNVVPA